MKQKTILLELLRWLCAGLAVVFLVVSFRQEPVSSAAFEDVASAVTAIPAARACASLAERMASTVTLPVLSRVSTVCRLRSSCSR